MKAVSEIGTFHGGFILDAISFPKGTVAPGSVHEDVIFRLGAIYGPVLSLIWFIPLGLSLLLNMDRKRHDEIIAALAEREEEEAGAGPES